MTTTLILNRQPYDGTDVTWNALRLAKTLGKRGNRVRIFLMNDGVDLARETTLKPEEYDHDLAEMVRKLHDSGAEVKACGTCMARCGIHKNQPYFHPDVTGTMDLLAQWVEESDQVISF